MDQTCIDTDDDDYEFEDAQEEQEKDMIENHQTSFMVAQDNISRYV